MTIEHAEPLRYKQDLDFLVGQALQHLVVARHQLILRFDGEGEIYVYGDVTVGRDALRFSDLPAAACKLTTLLERAITSIDLDPNGAIALTFQGGEQTVLHRSEIPHESYLVRGGAGSRVG